MVASKAAAETPGLPTDTDARNEHEAVGASPFMSNQRTPRAQPVGSSSRERSASADQVNRPPAGMTTGPEPSGAVVTAPG